MMTATEIRSDWLDAVKLRNRLEAGAARAAKQVARHPFRVNRRKLDIQIAEAELREFQHQLLTGQPVTEDVCDYLLARNRAELRLARLNERIKRAKQLAKSRTEPLKKAEAAIREIEHEILTGQSARPLFAQAGRNGVVESSNWEIVQDSIDRMTEELNAEEPGPDPVFVDDPDDGEMFELPPEAEPAKPFNMCDLHPPKPSSSRKPAAKKAEVRPAEWTRSEADKTPVRKRGRKAAANAL
jgi:hypothetical protein